MTRHPHPGGDQAGFTLIELMISLGLFALIAVAGLGLVDGILRVQGRTEVRMDRLAQLQRAMFAVTSDLDQIATGPIRGGGAELRFTRAAPGIGGPPVEVQYALAGDTLTRIAGPVPQVALSGVGGAQWRFDSGEGWVDKWPLSDAEAERWPRAVELRLSLPEGDLRRVIVLPAQVKIK